MISPGLVNASSLCAAYSHNEGLHQQARLGSLIWLGLDRAKLWNELRSGIGNMLGKDKE